MLDALVPFFDEQESLLSIVGLVSYSTRSWTVIEIFNIPIAYNPLGKRRDDVNIGYIWDGVLGVAEALDELV